MLGPEETITLWSWLTGPPEWRLTEQQRPGLYYLVSGYIWEYGPEWIRVNTLEKRYRHWSERGVLAVAADEAARLVGDRVRARVANGQVSAPSTMHWADLLRIACEHEPLPVFASPVGRGTPAFQITADMLNQGLKGTFEHLLGAKMATGIRKARRKRVQR